MCGRYTLTSSGQELASHFEAEVKGEITLVVAGAGPAPMPRVEDLDSAIRGRIEARDADGSLCEVSTLKSGDEVEVVGMGRRAAATAGETYRACNSEFEFDADEPVQVWVVRSR